MTDTPDLGAALVMGIGGGLRSFAPPVALAAALTSAFGGSRLRTRVHGGGRQFAAAVAEDPLS